MRRSACEVAVDTGVMCQCAEAQRVPKISPESSSHTHFEPVRTSLPKVWTEYLVVQGSEQMTSVVVPIPKVIIPELIIPEAIDYPRDDYPKVTILKVVIQRAILGRGLKCYVLKTVGSDIRILYVRYSQEVGRKPPKKYPGEILAVSTT